MECGSHTLGWIRIRARPWTKKNCCKEIYFIHHTSIPTTLQPCFTAAAAFLFEALCLMCTAAAILLYSDSVRGTINNQQQAAELWFAADGSAPHTPRPTTLNYVFDLILSLSSRSICTSSQQLFGGTRQLWNFHHVRKSEIWTYNNCCWPSREAQWSINPQGGIKMITFLANSNLMLTNDDNDDDDNVSLSPRLTWHILMPEETTTTRHVVVSCWWSASCLLLCRRLAALVQGFPTPM